MFLGASSNSLSLGLFDGVHLFNMDVIQWGSQNLEKREVAKPKYCHTNVLHFGESVP